MTESEKNIIKQNIANIRAEMNTALQKSPYKQEAILLAATKTRTSEEINYAISCGITHIGENKVQELIEKYPYIDKENVEIHFIGALQTNKVKYIIDKVEMIHSLDRISLAEEINKQAAKINKTMKVLVEVNIGDEESKSGVKADECIEFVEKLSKYPNIKVCGLMAIPPVCVDFDSQKQYFKKIMKIFIDISQKKLDNINMYFISFGMSNDYIPALEEGSNLIRIGTGIFGARNYNKQ